MLYKQIRLYILTTIILYKQINVQLIKHIYNIVQIDQIVHLSISILLYKYIRLYI